ncbi:hypothetical protein ACWEN6_24070 [Sphaerisporangium sp. NPDC004334]
MTKNSARKKAVRARQAAMGEAYNAARRQLEHDAPAASFAESLTRYPWVSSWDGDLVPSDSFVNDRPTRRAPGASARR